MARHYTWRKVDANHWETVQRYAGVPDGQVIRVNPATYVLSVRSTRHTKHFNTLAKCKTYMDGLSETIIWRDQ